MAAEFRRLVEEYLTRQPERPSKKIKQEELSSKEEREMAHLIFGIEEDSKVENTERAKTLEKRLSELSYEASSYIPELRTMLLTIRDDIWSQAVPKKNLRFSETTGKWPDPHYTAQWLYGQSYGSRLDNVGFAIGKRRRMKRHDQKYGFEYEYSTSLTYEQEYIDHTDEMITTGEDIPTVHWARVNNKETYRHILRIGLVFANDVGKKRLYIIPPKTFDFRNESGIKQYYSLEEPDGLKRFQNDLLGYAVTQAPKPHEKEIWTYTDH